MHSSRVSTARLLPYLPACSVPEGVPGSGVLVPGGAWSQGCLVLGGVPGPRGCTWFQGVPGPGGVLFCTIFWDTIVTCPGIPPPPLNRMTDRCKNITLPQTSFAGGNNSITVENVSLKLSHLI